MKKAGVIFGILVLVSVWLSACGGSTPTPTPTATTVPPTLTPEPTATFTPSPTPIVLNAGAGDAVFPQSPEELLGVIGVSEGEPGYDETLGTLESLGAEVAARQQEWETALGGAEIEGWVIAYDEENFAWAVLPRVSGKGLAYAVDSSGTPFAYLMPEGAFEIRFAEGDARVFSTAGGAFSIGVFANGMLKGYLDETGELAKTERGDTFYRLNENGRALEAEEVLQSTKNFEKRIAEEYERFNSSRYSIIENDLYFDPLETFVPSKTLEYFDIEPEGKFIGFGLGGNEVDLGPDFEVVQDVFIDGNTLCSLEDESVIMKFNKDGVVINVDGEEVFVGELTNIGIEPGFYYRYNEETNKQELYKETRITINEQREFNGEDITVVTHVYIDGEWYEVPGPDVLDGFGRLHADGGQSAGDILNHKDESDGVNSDVLPYFTRNANEYFRVKSKDFDDKKFVRIDGDNGGIGDTYYNHGINVLPIVLAIPSEDGRGQKPMESVANVVFDARRVVDDENKYIGDAYWIVLKNFSGYSHIVPVVFPKDRVSDEIDKWNRFIEMEPGSLGRYYRIPISFDGGVVDKKVQDMYGQFVSSILRSSVGVGSSYGYVLDSDDATRIYYNLRSGAFKYLVGISPDSSLFDEKEVNRYLDFFVITPAYLYWR